ncbi:cysteine hydrolase family protein [Paenibacillus physcomitrellae]|uniref:Isochorismatase n=1 Tax=Paenibacillus physcomitrellae TaxID=1619311 RepID=A0ABQ1GF95_9BACL|nr:cysteine hydrolase family protein [Paenibacillus physcomitrellae]GGA42391.1 isochorismatase [Paenibacillus physcomitrellae]
MSKAVIVIDVQEAFFENPSCLLHEKEQLVRNINALIEQARRQAVPVVFIQHTEYENPDDEFLIDTPDWQLHRGLNRLESDPVIRKSTPDSFHETDLADYLREQGIDQLIFAGAQTDFCINATIRRAHTLGYKDNILLKDGHSTVVNSVPSAAQIIEDHEQSWGGLVAIKPLREIEL